MTEPTRRAEPIWLDCRLRGASGRRSRTPSSSEMSLAASPTRSKQGDIARPYALFVLTLEGGRISAITWFGENRGFRRFGLPQTLEPGVGSGLR